MGTPGTLCSPHPSQKAQMHYFFPCEDTGGRDGREGQELEYKKTSKIQKKPPNFIPNGVGKAGAGCRPWGWDAGGQKEPLKLRTERDSKRP